MSHTILLVQPGVKPETRTYSDYESVNECMEGVCKLYEEHLKKTNPTLPSITYDISQLFDFIDQVYRALINLYLNKLESNESEISRDHNVMFFNYVLLKHQLSVVIINS